VAGKAPDAVTAARGRARRFPRSLWVLLAGDAFQSLGFGLVTPYLTLYLTDTIGASPAVAGILLAAFSLGAIPATPLGGILSDRLGRRPVMLTGLAGQGVVAIAFALVSGVWPVAILIVGWAVFSSLFDPAAQGYIADAVAPGLRVEAFALKRLVNAAFFAVGVPLGALLVWLSSLRAAFLAAGIASLVYLAIIWWGLPESRTRRQIEAEPQARFAPALRDRALMTLAAGAFITYGMFSLYEGSIPVFLNRERGLEIAAWGAIFAINPILLTLFQYPAGRWAARRDPRRVLAAGALLYGASLALLIPDVGLWLIVVGVVVFSIGEMLFEPVVTGVAADLAPTHLRGTYQSVLNLSLEVVWAPASIVGLWAIGRGQGELLLAASPAAAGVAAIVFLGMRRVTRKQEARPAAAVS
jgi:MFS family permease